MVDNPLPTSLQSGLDITVIALLLGHEDPATTHIYVEADLAMKEAALQRGLPGRQASPLQGRRPPPRLP